MSGSYSLVRPRPCSSTCRWARCATHRQKCSAAHFGRVPAAPCITAEGTGRFQGLARAAGLDICRAPPYLGAFQFTFCTVFLNHCLSRILVPPRQAHRQNADFSLFFWFADSNRSSRVGSQFVDCNEPSGSQFFGHEKASGSQFVGHKKGIGIQLQCQKKAAAVSSSEHKKARGSQFVGRKKGSGNQCVGCDEPSRSQFVGNKKRPAAVSSSATEKGSVVGRKKGSGSQLVGRKKRQRQSVRRLQKKAAAVSLWAAKNCERQSVRWPQKKAAAVKHTYRIARDKKQTRWMGCARRRMVFSFAKRQASSESVLTSIPES